MIVGEGEMVVCGLENDSWTKQDKMTWMKAHTFAEALLYFSPLLHKVLCLFSGFNQLVANAVTATMRASGPLPS